MTPIQTARLRLTLQIALPILVLTLTALGVRKMIANISKPPTNPPVAMVPIVRTITAESHTMRLDVESQGSVEPALEVDLAPQVAGRVLKVSPSLRAGAFFAKDQVLLEIDPQDLQFAIVQRRAEVARARLRLAQETAEAEVASRAWQQLEGERKPDELATRELHVKGAEADLAAAEALLQRAELDLKRTKVSLPFAGRVRSVSVDPGDLVQPNSIVAVVYAIEAVEVRLPIPDNQVAFVDMPFGPDHGNGDSHHPDVSFVANYAGTSHKWHGQVVRTEGEIDRRTRQVTLVARIENPYGSDDDKRPPLTPGLYVEGTIAGRTFDDVISLPRQALRPDGSVLVLDKENRLRSRAVSVLRMDRDQVHVRGGLNDGDEVCVSVVEEFVEGMPVQAPETPASSGDQKGMPGPVPGKQGGGR